MKIIKKPIVFIPIIIVLVILAIRSINCSKKGELIYSSNISTSGLILNNILSVNKCCMASEPTEPGLEYPAGSKICK